MKKVMDVAVPILITFATVVAANAVYDKWIKSRIIK